MNKMLNGSFFDPPGSIWIACLYALGALGAVIVLDDPIQIFVMAGLTFFGCTWHLYFRVRTYERNFWGGLFEPIPVIDWGPYGEEIYKTMPSNLQGKFIAAKASDVEEVIKEVEKKLKDCKNELYLSGAIDVYPIFFRFGEHVNERPKMYLKRLIYEMETKFQEHHTNAADKNKSDVETYKDLWIRSNLNGSAS